MQSLPPKERKLFSDLLQAYEQKQLARGRKIADQILKKHPQHGETLCMKGLFQVHQGERDPGIALVKAGMRNDLQSHICWHVWALIQKGEHNYEEALKSYAMALRIDKDNFNILRETAILQTHIRQYDALVDARLHMLRLRPYVRVHWIGAALAHLLAGNLPEARRFLDHLDAFLRNVPPRDPEYAELVFFHVRLLEQLGDPHQALALLDAKAADGLLLDRPAIAECRARLYGALQATDADDTQKLAWAAAADRAWRDLVDQNPDNQAYYERLLANAGITLDALTDASRAKALDILDAFASDHPKAHAHRRLALAIAQGDTFKALVEPYLQRAIQKGIPSLFSDLKTLYADPFKRDTIQSLIEDLSAHPADPADYLWALYFLAQHYASLGEYPRTLDVLQRAIAHTPTLPELYMTKARVLKRAGDPYGAVRAMDDARRLDGQDRYVNTKSAKYRLRAGMVSEADDVLALFTKKGMLPATDLLDMQALHYLVELGDAHRRFGRYHLALKTYYAIQKVFDKFREEQYDFHLYSLRKSMLGSYMGMLAWEDNLHSHPAYTHAAVWSARIWIQLYDDPSIIKSLHPPEPSGEVSKKALNKAKKAAHKATTETPDLDEPGTQKARGKQNEDKGLEPPQAKDDDPEGLKLVTADDPLERASKFLATLGTFGKGDIEVNMTTFDVAIRQKKYLKAAQALRRAHATDAQHPRVHVRIVELAQRANEVPETFASVLDEAIGVLKPDGMSLDAFHSQYLQSRGTCARALVACAKVSRMLGGPREQAEEIVFGAFAEGVWLGIEEAREMLDYLREIQSPRTEAFRIECDGRFALSKMFKTEAEQAAMRRQCVDGGEENEVETVF